MNFKNVMFNREHALVHRPTGRRFFYVPARSVQMQVQGLDITVSVAETLTEVINGILCPCSLPTTFLFDEWDVGTLESVMPEAFHDQKRMHEADEENRVGIVTISESLWCQYAAAIRGAININIRHESTADKDVIIVFTSPDIEPVKEGQATPHYTIGYDEELNKLSFMLVKGVKL